MKKFMVFMFLMFLAACSSTTPMYQYTKVAKTKQYHWQRTIPVYVSHQFTEGDKVAIRDAVDAWNNVLNGHVSIQIKNEEFFANRDADIQTALALKEANEGWILLKMDHDNPALADEIEDGDGVLAFVNRLGSSGHLMFVLGDRIGSKDLKSILLHEMGHLLGAQHVSARSLMYPSYGIYANYRCIDKITVAQVSNYQHIPIEEMNYCVTPEFN